MKNKRLDYELNIHIYVILQNYRFLDLLHVLCVCDDIAIPNNQSYIVKRWMQVEQVHAMYMTVQIKEQ